MDFPKLKNHTFSPHTLYCFNSRVALVDGSGEGPHPCHMRNWWVSLWAMNLFLISLFFFLKVVQFSCSLFDEFFCHILIIGCFDQPFFQEKLSIMQRDQTMNDQLSIDCVFLTLAENRIMWSKCDQLAINYVLSNLRLKTILCDRTWIDPSLINYAFVSLTNKCIMWSNCDRSNLFSSALIKK